MSLLCLFLLVVLPPSAAFKQGIHEDITETALTALGFDEDSADEVGDSNYYTDVFEPNNAAAHADGNELGAASARLRAKRTQIGDALNACRRREALDALGEALHTVQDIYSHSNSVDNGIAVGDLFGLVDGTAPCDSANGFAPGGLVTGYFSAFGWATGNQCRGLPAGMCCHRELNKDAPDEPNGARHPAARAAAAADTRAYVEAVENDLRARFGATQGEQLVKMLERKQRTVMFVIDDTGSMSTDIAGVKSSANSFLNQLQSSDEAPTLGLVTFKDSVSNRGLTCNIDTLRSQINGLFASGGGDCPEALNSALLSAIFTFPQGRGDIQLRGGRILSATDASARDASLGPQVQVEASVRGISIDAILTGDCTSDPFTSGDTRDSAGQSFDGPAREENPRVYAMDGLGAEGARSHTGDPLTSPSARVQLPALTEQTGGVLFNVSRIEVDDVVPTLLALGDPNSGVILGRSLALGGPVPTVVTVPVDETVGAVTFLATAATSSARPTVVVARPDGTPVMDTDPDVTIRVLSSVVTTTVTAPTPGLWQVALTGTGDARFRAFAATDLRVDGLRLSVPLADPSRPEVEIEPLDGQPLAGSTVIADIRLTLAPNDADLFLVREDGVTVDAPMLFPVDFVRRFRAEVVVPSEDFVVFEVRGQTAGGFDFVRQITAPVLPQEVAIEATPRVAVGPVGSGVPIALTITNQGTVPATFGFVVSTPLGWPVQFPTGAITVGAGETATFDPGIIVVIPSFATEGDRNEMAIRLQDLADPTRRNSATFSVVAGPPNQPPSCDGAVASEPVLWPPNHAFVPIDIFGVDDPDGDLVTITIAGITQDEPVDGTGSGDTAPDGRGVGSPTAEVRAERDGGGDGRVYAIAFDADDGNGGTCSGEVRVGVPHDKKSEAVDSGQAFDSTIEP